METINIEALVADFVRLRDAKAAIKAEADRQTSQISEVMAKIEAQLLAYFDAAGLDNARTASGTAYRSRTVMATVSDWDSFIQHVAKTGDFQLLERRCAKRAVEEFMEVNQSAPPGVNVRSEVGINIRRS